MVKDEEESAYRIGGGLHIFTWKRWTEIMQQQTDFCSFLFRFFSLGWTQQKVLQKTRWRWWMIDHRWTGTGRGTQKHCIRKRNKSVTGAASALRLGTHQWSHRKTKQNILSLEAGGRGCLLRETRITRTTLVKKLVGKHNSHDLSSSLPFSISKTSLHKFNLI